MSHKIISSGFIAKQPPLQTVGQHVKIEFDVLSKRYGRISVEEGHGEITEAVTFVAWDEEAAYLADKLVPGREVEVMGIQETSSWIDSGSGQSRSRKLFRVVNCEIKRSSQSNRPAGQGEGQGFRQRQQHGGQQGGQQRQPRNNHASAGRHEHSHYEDPNQNYGNGSGSGGYVENGEPVASRQQRGDTSRSRPPAAAPRYASKPAQGQGGGGNVAGGANPQGAVGALSAGDRFVAVY